MKLVPPSELTTEQLRAVELGIQEHRLIVGGPGSGKTQILLHRADHLRRIHRVPDDEFFVIVFTRALKDYIRSAARMLDIPEENIDTLDHWCMDFYREQIGGRLPYDGARKMPDFASIRQATSETLAEEFDEPPYRFVLVDEGQDLDPDAFDLIRRMASHVTVCADHKQQIYDVGSPETAILRRLALRQRNLSLLETYRCTPYIMQLATNFVTDPQEAREFSRQCRLAVGAREMPLSYVADDFQDEKQRLIEVLRTRLSRGERIAILVPTLRQMYGFAKGLQESGFEVETKRDLDFGTSCPKVLPYPSAKGLTFDTVLMPRLTARSFANMEKDRIRRLLFVAISRATEWVYMSTTESEFFREFPGFEEAAESGALEVQIGASEFRTPSSAVPPRDTADHLSGDDTDLLDLL